MSAPGPPASPPVASVEFVSILRHALMTPLSGIVLWCDMIRRSPALSESLDRALTSIDHSARAQVAILDNVVEHCRMQAGSTQLARSPVDLLTCLEDVMSQNSSVAKQREVNLSFARPTGDLTVAGDPVRLRTAIHNLVDNAITNSPKGAKVDVRLEAGADTVSVVVVDEGNGIAADRLPALFSAQPLTEAALVRRRGGLGLGLPVTRWVVGLHGGSVNASANTPRGCIFTITLRR